jgi:selenide,water dikinase
VELTLADVPIMDGALDLAGMGLVPAGSFANKNFCSSQVAVADGLDAVRVDLVFDAQTSGGLVLAVPEERVEAVQAFLRERGDMAACIGRVVPREDADASLNIV